MIKTINLNRNFGKYNAIDNVNLEVKEGDIFGFIGSNGAGKTTVMRILSTLMKPTSGEVEIGGIKVIPKNYLKVRDIIGFMPQNTRFNENLYPEEIIKFFCSIRKCDSKKYTDLLKEIKGDFNKKAKNLSPGHQKKLQLTLAMIGSPELIILDEPTAGLDPIGVDEFREIVKMLKQQGHTIFISSHNLKELENLCNRIAVIHHGKLLYSGVYKNAYEFETDISSDILKNKLNFFEGYNYKMDDNKIIMYIDRNELPGIVKRIVSNDIPIYGIKEQSLEVLYRDAIAGGE